MYPIVTTRAYARGKVIGFVSTKILDLDILASEQSVNTTKILENGKKLLVLASNRNTRLTGTTNQGQIQEHRWLQARAYQGSAQVDLATCDKNVA